MSVKKGENKGVDAQAAGGPDDRTAEDLRVENRQLEARVRECKRAKDTLRAIIEGTSSATGQEYLRSLVMHLALALRFRYALIGELVDGRREKIRTLAVWADGAFAKDFEYALADTPCENVVGQSVCSYPTGVQKLFPEDHLLVEMGVESYTGAPLFSSDGRPLGILVALDDKPMEDGADVPSILKVFAARASLEIERKAAEDRLKRSEERLKEAQRIAHIGDWDWNLEGDRLYWSDEVYRIFGMEPQAVEVTYRTFIDSVYPDDRAFVEKALNAALNCLDHYSIDHRIVLPDGRIRIVNGRAEVIFGADVRPVRMRGTMQDVTERRVAETHIEESERKFRSLMENMPAGIAVTTEDDAILEANTAMWRAFGYGSREELLKEKASVFYRAMDKGGRAAEAIMRAGARDLEVRARRKDGSEFTGELTSLVQKAEDGRPRFIILLQDVTEKKLMEDEIFKAKKIETIGDLAGSIAHDFNNLLVGILGRVSVAKKLVDKDDRLHGILSGVEEAALTAKGLTRRLLTFSSGGQPVKEAASVADLLRSTAELVLRESNVRCEFSFPDGDVYADMDEGQVGQAMNNIILNARQAMEGGGIVEIEARNVDVAVEDSLPIEPGRYVKVSIKDNGAGIPEEHLGRVFDPFFTTRQKASGLGLAVTYSVIKKHGGHIAVESKDGRGTAVHVYLPASVGRPAQAAGSLNVDRGSGRVLVMDDDEMVREVAGEMLDLLGYEYSFAGDGHEAVALFKKAIEAGSPFDAVILDLTVDDGMGGAEAVRRLRTIDPKVKAIVSSGYSRDRIMSEYREHGFCAVMHKPYRLEEFSRVVKEAISDKG